MVHHVMPLRRSQILEHLVREVEIFFVGIHDDIGQQKHSPRTLLLGFHGVNDANGKSEALLAILQSQNHCNGLRDVKCTHAAFIVNPSNEPNSPRVYSHFLTLE